MFKPMSFDLEEVEKLFRQKRVLELRGLSNRLIREAAIENNFGKAELGVIAYALHKMETKQHFLNNKKWLQVKKVIAANLRSALLASKNKDSKQLITKLKKVIESIEGIDAELGHFAEGIYEKGKTKQASLAYSYGLSISQSAELTGADKKELQSYIGFTKMPDEEQEQKNIIVRVKELRKLVEAKK
jgi:hypothetical protein